MARGNALLQAGDAVAVKTRKRNRETVPEFLLELLEHGLHGQDQDATAAATFHEFRYENAGFECFTDTYGVGDQNAGARSAQRLDGGSELVVEHVHGGVLRDVDLRVRGGCLSQERLDEELRLHVGAGVVLDEPRFFRQQNGDLVFKTLNEAGFLAANEVRDADASEFVRVILRGVGGKLHTLHEPFGVTDQNAHARSKSGRLGKSRR